VHANQQEGQSRGEVVGRAGRPIGITLGPVAALKTVFPVPTTKFPPPTTELVAPFTAF